MRVMFINRPKGLWIGGDYVQMERTAEELRKLGIEVDIEETPLPSPAIKMYTYDIVHIWNFSMPWSKLGVWASAAKKRKTVVSMIYHEGPDHVSYKDQQLMLNCMDAALWLTDGEVDRLTRHCTLPTTLKSAMIPNGIDESWFGEYTQGDYLLTVGRIEPSKGQLAVAKAAKELGLRYVCVGERTDIQYARECDDAGAEIIPPTTNKDVLKRWYTGCSALVLASRAEIMPLTVMEAGAQGKQIILTDHCEWKIPAQYVEWNNETQIKEAIKNIPKVENVELKNMLKEMTWEKTALRIKEVYEDILLNSNAQSEELSGQLSPVAKKPDAQ